MNKLEAGRDATALMECWPYGVPTSVKRKPSVVRRQMDDDRSALATKKREELKRMRNQARNP